MISDNLPALFREKKEHISVSTADFDIGFIARQIGVQGAFVREIEVMAVKGRGFRVIEHGLMRDGNPKELAEHQRRFARPDGKRDVKGENQTDPMRRVMNAMQVHTRR